VQKRLLQHVKELNPSLAIFVTVHEDDILAQARASTQRHANNAPLSIFDGVPCAIKDEVHVRGYKSHVGTSFVGHVRGVEAEDATVVARLRALGAILIGKTNMYEVGAGTSGANYHWGMPRNPYNTTRYTGGSSAGSGSVVSSGIAPIAIGADGGGSIRIPAAFNGIVGLKPTFGRVPETGAFPLCWSVAHMGPMAATVSDAALLYLAIQGPDPADGPSMAQPHNDFQMSDLQAGPPAKLRIGLFHDWNADSDPVIHQAFQRVMEQARQAGATLVPIHIPYLAAIQKAHTVTIGSEMRASLNQYLKANRTLFSLEVRASMAFFDGLKTSEYIDAAKVRTHAIHTMKEIFEQVDVVATPATGVLAPVIPPESLQSGYSDVQTLGNIMKYMQLGNFVGLPGIVLPIQYDQHNVPLALHLMADHWNEKLLLQVAFQLERQLLRQPPQVHVRYDL